MSLCIINEMLVKSDKGDQTILRSATASHFRIKAKYQGPGAEPRENFCICIWIWGYFLGSEDSDFGCN